MQVQKQDVSLGLKVGEEESSGPSAESRTRSEGSTEEEETWGSLTEELQLIVCTAADWTGNEIMRLSDFLVARGHGLGSGTTAMSALRHPLSL